MPVLSMNVTPEMSMTTGPPALTAGASAEETLAADAMSISPHKEITAFPEETPTPSICSTSLPTPNGGVIDRPSGVSVWCLTQAYESDGG